MRLCRKAAALSCAWCWSKAAGGQPACLFNFLYWNFLIEHEQVLRGNQRMGPTVLSLRHAGADEQQLIQLQAEEYLANPG